MPMKSKQGKKQAPARAEEIRPEQVVQSESEERQEQPQVKRLVERPMSFMRNHRWLMVIIAFAIVLYTVVQQIDVVYRSLNTVLAVMQPVTVGFCIAFVLNGLMNFIEKKLLFAFDTRAMVRLHKFKRPLAVLLTVLVALGAVTMVALVLGPRLGDSINLVISNLPGSGDDLNEWLNEKLGGTQLPPAVILKVVETVDKLVDQLIDFITTEYAALMSTALSLTSTLFSFVFDLVVSLIIATYVLLQKEQIGRAVRKMLSAYASPRVHDVVLDVSECSYNTFANFVKGQLLEAGVLGGLCYLGMLLFRFPNAPMVSLMVGITALIPVFGAWLGGGVSAFLIMLVDPSKALWFVLFLLVLQQLEGNLIYPRVVGNVIGLPGLLVLCAVVIGGNIGGMAGMLLGVPIVAVAYELIRRNVEKRLEEKEKTGKSAS